MGKSSPLFLGDTISQQISWSFGFYNLSAPSAKMFPELSEQPLYCSCSPWGQAPHDQLLLAFWPVVVFSGLHLTRKTSLMRDKYSSDAVMLFRQTMLLQELQTNNKTPPAMGKIPFELLARGIQEISLNTISYCCCPLLPLEIEGETLLLKTPYTLEVGHRR